MHISNNESLRMVTNQEYLNGELQRPTSYQPSYSLLVLQLPTFLSGYGLLVISYWLFYKFYYYLLPTFLTANWYCNGLLSFPVTGYWLLVILQDLLLPTTPTDFPYRQLQLPAFFCQLFILPLRPSSFYLFRSHPQWFPQG